jgi:hypothetical protein
VFFVQSGKKFFSNTYHVGIEEKLLIIAGEKLQGYDFLERRSQPNLFLYLSLEPLERTLCVFASAANQGPHSAGTIIIAL